MGTFSVSIEVGSPDRKRWERVEALVDTGATFSWLPEPLLRDLGYTPDARESFEIGDGRVIESDVGEVSARMGDKVRTTLCAYAKGSKKPVGGAITLETFLLAPDPVNQRLVPVAALHISHLLREGEAP